MNVCIHRLIEEHGEELSVDLLSKDLKSLTKQTKTTKYREVMKLLRLVLSGLQVPIYVVMGSNMCAVFARCRMVHVKAY